jgi:hypothetical protein
MTLFFARKMVAVRQIELAGKATPSHVVLHPERQGEFVSERTKGFCMKLAVVSWIVSHLPILYIAQLSNSECSVCMHNCVHAFV